MVSSVRVYVLNTGSSGNLTIIESGGARIVLEAGLNPTAAATRMRVLGAELFPAGALGIVVTHHHGDHISRLHPLAKALRAPIHLHAGVDAPRIRDRFDVKTYVPGTRFSIGPFDIDTILIPHDAPQVAVRVAAGDRSFALCTDLGHVPRGLAALLARCDVVLVEANYCPVMLAEGPYPPRLRERVAGPLGHLSNEATAELVAQLRNTRVARVLLGHLSRHNNTPARALEIVRARAGSLPVDVVPHGAPMAFDVERCISNAPFEQLILPLAVCS